MSDIEGRIGDTSGRIGDTSGRIGDTSGRIGDTSGRSMEEMQRDVTRGRLVERINFLESRLFRLEDDMLRLAGSLDARLTVIEDRIIADTLRDKVNDALKPLADQVQRLEDRLDAIKPNP